MAACKITKPTAINYTSVLKPKKVSALSKAKLLVLQTRFAEARSRLKNFLKESPGHEMAPEAQFMIGESYDMENKAEPAKAAYQKTIDDYPDTPQAGTAAMMLKRYAVKEKNYKKALEFVKLSMEHNKMNSNIEDGIFALATIYDKYLRKPDKALGEYSKLLKDTQNPRLAPKSYLGAIKIYQKKGEDIKVVQLATVLAKKYTWSKESRQAKEILEKYKKR